MTERRDSREGEMPTGRGREEVLRVGERSSDRGGSGAG